MYFTYFTATCSNCGNILFFKITKLLGFIRVTSKLGPNFVVCSSCDTKMMTGNKEWQQMSLTEKLWFVVLSVFYGVAIGFMSSMAIGVAVEKTFARTLSTEQAGLFIVTPITLIVLAIQILRILRSLERTENNEESKKTVNFWEWETNLQFYGILWIILATLSTIPFLVF